MFMGEYTHSIDSKNRIIIPSKFRGELGINFVVSKGLDGCLYCYPPAEWEKILVKLESLPENRAENRKYIRYFTTSAQEVETDRQGRALIPSNLVKFAELSGEIVITGVRNKLEIWSLEKWNSYQEDDFDIESIAENIGL